MLNDDDFIKLGIDAQRRAETLSVAEFVVITNYLYSAV
jgi:16S rRNA A1518/A1519 N6-dimethyltransferase RsmA/KsgA/DIM1 with predicted DNA glycosylase/AP lyase activity